MESMIKRLKLPAVKSSTQVNNKSIESKLGIEISTHFANFCHDSLAREHFKNKWTTSSWASPQQGHKIDERSILRITTLHLADNRLRISFQVKILIFIRRNLFHLIAITPHGRVRWSNRDLASLNVNCFFIPRLHSYESNLLEIWIEFNNSNKDWN